MALAPVPVTVHTMPEPVVKQCENISKSHMVINSQLPINLLTRSKKSNNLTVMGWQASYGKHTKDTVTYLCMHLANCILRGQICFLNQILVLTILNYHYQYYGDFSV